MSPIALDIVNTIQIKETGGTQNCNDIRGASGEIGCLQMLPSTYRKYSIQVLGYEAPRTEVNMKYVAVLKSQEMVYKGIKVEKQLLSWNAGEAAKQCSQGVNSMGVPYNSCDYVQKGMEIYKKLSSKR